MAWPGVVQWTTRQRDQKVSRLLTAVNSETRRIAREQAAAASPRIGTNWRAAAAASRERQRAVVLRQRATMQREPVVTQAVRQQPEGKRQTATEPLRAALEPRQAEASQRRNALEPRQAEANQRRTASGLRQAEASQRRIQAMLLRAGSAQRDSMTRRASVPAALTPVLEPQVWQTRTKDSALPAAGALAVPDWAAP